MRLPRFQFSLRTLFIVVTLLSIPCGYVGYQAKIVAERKSMQDRIKEIGGSVILAAEMPHSWWHEDNERPTVNWIRSWLGDEAFDEIVIPRASSLRDTIEVCETFPEAYVSTSRNHRFSWCGTP